MTAAPLAGVSVVEVAVGVSDVGLGLAGGGPGMLLAGLGADVVRYVGTRRPAIDGHVEWGRVWHRDKRVVATDDAGELRAAVAGADVALVYGPEPLVEGRGLGWVDLCPTSPALVHVRCRPSRTARGTVADAALLVEAASGFCTQLDGHRPGPIFVDVRAAASGTAFLLTSAALALLRRRALTGAGGWAETSLYDGMLATLGCMIGRSERAAPEIEGYWTHGSTFPNFLYRCADGELVQVWFGGKGMYASLIEVLGDEPSADGYYADQMTGMLQERARRWRSTFAEQPRDVWIERLRAAGVACEPVLGPGEALAEPHAAETGLAVPAGGDVVVGCPITVTPSPAPLVGDFRRSTASITHNRGLLDGVRVLDFSAFVAGPLGAQVLGDLGADVVKVEPPEGEAMRAAAYAMAAGQRGKRSLAMDIGAPEARPVVEALVRWADVVVHNFRVGVAERLGIGADTVAELNPRAVYCHASAFGPSGPRARFPGNDALMQAVTGFERAVGGEGNDPIAGTWIPIDMSGGWLAGAGMLAGLYATACSGRGQQVATSLLGAGMLLQSGVFLRDGELVRGPALDGQQTGYGPGYRIYRCADDAWLALVVDDDDAWRRLRSLVPDLAEPYAPLRGGGRDEAARKAEAVLEAAFASAPAAAWIGRLRALDLRVEPVESQTRDEFRRGILDDPLNRQLGRAVAYDVEAWGHFEQIGALLRCGPDAGSRPRLSLPEVGEHSVEVLAELGFSPEETTALLEAKVVRRR